MKLSKKLRDQFARIHCSWWAEPRGSALCEFRQQAMLELTGEKLPMSKCGVHAYRKALMACLGIKEDCIAREDRAIVERIQEELKGE